MSIEQRRTETVYAVIQELVDQGRTSFRPADVTSILRDQGQPLGAWEVRGEFSILEARGLIELNAESADWSLTKVASREAAG